MPTPAPMLASPTPAAILARFKAVTGGAAWDSVRTLHTVSAVSASMLSGTDDEWDDVMTGRSTSHLSLGPLQQATGFDGTRAWEQSDTSAAHALDSVDGQQEASDSAYITALGFWYPERRGGASVSYIGARTDAGTTYDVLSAVPKGGHAVQLWFDRGTGLLARIVDHGAEQTQTIFLSDYRAVPGSGVMEPHSARQSVGIARYDFVETTTSEEVNAAPPPNEFVQPAPPQQTDFTFAGGASSVTVPFHYSNAHIFLPLKINGHPFDAIFDTGGAYVVDTSVAKQLGLKPEGTLQATGNGAGSVDAGRVRVDSVQIGGLTLRRPLFVSLPLPASIRATPIVGAELLQRFIVSIDYDNKTITFTQPGSFRAPAAGAAKAIGVAFQFNGNMPEVNGSVDGVPGAFTIDTGSGSSLDLDAPFVAANHLKEKYKPKFTVISGYGIGGPDYSAMVRVKTLALGGALVHDRITGLREGTAGAASNNTVAGNVGNGVLHEFNLVFDYPNQTITFTPNHQYSQPDEYSRSGIALSADSDKALVADVVPGSPAALAGIKPGDVLLSLNGQSLTNLAASSQTFRSRFTHLPAGARVTLKLLPGGKGKPHTVTFVLRDLI